MTLSHFKHDGVLVYEGQRVVQGQLLGYCGNSGRSPLPHLHLQVQAGPNPVAATIPFRIRQYVSIDPKTGCRFHYLGIPEQGARIAPLTFDSDIAACFEACLSTRVRYRIESLGRATTWETIEIVRTAEGQRCYRSVERSAVLWATTTEGIHVTGELEGSSASLLSSLWLGLSIVPYSHDRRIHWQDEFDPRPFRSAPLGWLDDLTAPFFGIRFLRLNRHFEDATDAGSIVVTTETALGSKVRPSNIPRRIVVRLDREAGLVELTVTTDVEVLRIFQESRENIA